MVSEQQRLKDSLRYCPVTGDLYWKRKVGSRGFEGQKAGYFCNTHKYMQMQFEGKPYKSHRVAWLLYYGDWPKGQIDHINGNRSDNRIDNLRDVSLKENMLNKPSYKGKTSKYKGVSWRKDFNKWRALIQRDGKPENLGHFDCEREAALVYNHRAEQLFGEYAWFNEVFDDI